MESLSTVKTVVIVQEWCESLRRLDGISLLEFNAMYIQRFRNSCGISVFEMESLRSE